MNGKILLPLIVAAVLTGCSEEKKAEVHEEVLRPVKVVEITPADSDRALNYSGAVRARREIASGFRVAGKVTERRVDIGQHVSEGDLLARLDPTDYQLQVAAAEAALTAAERGVETAQLTLDRARQLYGNQVAAKSQLDQAELSFNQAVATRDSSKAQLDQARNQVSYTDLKADRAGIVTATSAEPGQVVSAGSPVVTVALDGEKEVLIAVPETDIRHFEPGTAVDVGIWSDSNLRLSGKVREIAGSADTTSRTFAVRVSLPQDARVLLGMTASVSVTAKGENSRFDLPLSALAKTPEGASIVWTVDRVNETVHSRPVTLADFSDSGVRVTDGLKPGDLVVAAGTQFMTENLKVKLPGNQIRQAAAALTN